MNSSNLVTTLLIAAIGGAISAALMILVLDTHSDTAAASLSPDRLERLETDLNHERRARLDQEQLIVKLERSINKRLAAAQTPVNVINELKTTEVTATATQRLDSSESAAQLSPKEQRHLDLVAAGFSEGEARKLARRESDEALRALEQQHQLRRQRSQQFANNDSTAQRPANSLRAEIGDGSYEKYLRSRGLPTEIGIANVLTGSAGENAGLKRGDKLRSYNGQRVFSVRELNRLTVVGDQGESVLVEVERDGEPIQLTLPRGPIGIVSNRSRDRFQR